MLTLNIEFFVGTMEKANMCMLTLNIELFVETIINRNVCWFRACYHVALGGDAGPKYYTRLNALFLESRIAKVDVPWYLVDAR